MRYILYLLYLIIFSLGEFFSTRNAIAAQKLSNYFVIVFLIVCTDFAIRLRKSFYIFFPIGMALSMLLLMLRVITDDMGDVLYSLLYLVLAYLLLQRAYIIRKYNSQRTGIALGVVGILCFGFALKLLKFVPVLSVIVNGVFDHYLIYLIMVAVCALVAFMGGYMRNCPRESELLLFLILLNAVPLLSRTLFFIF